jgi:hypothetical protein
MSEIEILTCTCGKRFPINKWKHPNRKIVYSPCCKVPFKNKFFNKEWKPNEQWHKNKHIGKPFTVGDMRRILQGIFNKMKESKP